MPNRLMRTFQAILTGTVSCAAVLAPSVMLAEETAQTRAAAYLVKEQIFEGCLTEAGSFGSTGIIERDLTGDGLLDLILDHHEIECEGDLPKSDNCEGSACQVLLYVRSEGLLVLTNAYLSIGLTVSGRGVPVIHLMSPEEKEFQVRWDGDSFEAFDPSAPPPKEKGDPKDRLS